MAHPTGTTQTLVRRRVQLSGPSAALSTPQRLFQNNPCSWRRGCPFCLLSGGHNTVGSPFQESRGLHSSVGYRTTQPLSRSKAQSEDSRGLYLSHRMTQTRDDCASTRLPAACHSLQRAVKRLEKRKTLSCMVCWGWIHPSGSRERSLASSHHDNFISGAESDCKDSSWQQGKDDGKLPFMVWPVQNTLSSRESLGRSS